jgi:hypothetical protein
MAGIVAAGANLMLGGLTANAGFVSLHTADPGLTGTSEVTGGSPAYARKAITWTSPSSSAMSNSAQIVFDVPTGTTIRFLGYWSASTGGTFYGNRALDANQTYTSQGTYTLAIGNISESIA